MSEQLPESPRLTEYQEASLRNLCADYDVDFDPEHYQHTPELPEGYVAGFVGGPSHAPQNVREWGIKPERTTIYVSIGPDTEPGPKPELTFPQQQEITRILEGYRANPSNSNKFRFELFAYIDSILAGDDVRQTENDL